jgi:hypothetical protein
MRRLERPLLGAWLGLALAMLSVPGLVAAPAAAGSVPLAVLGDSDSQAYQDRIWMPNGRGGAHAQGTFQWTEALVALRGQALDLGAWGIWGSRKRLVQAAEWLGVAGRAPRKQDHQYNFAFAGAGCSDLNEGVFRQAPRLLVEMNHEPDRWRNGIVVIRIGINGLGWLQTMDAFASNPRDAAAVAVAEACLADIKRAMVSLRGAHPSIRFVLVGIFNNADWPPYFDRWRSAQAIANINAGLDSFDAGLRQLTAATPRSAFFDERAWFRGQWGQRGREGEPTYRVVSLRSGLQVTLTQGDAPEHAVLADGHAGLVWNALWAQALVALLRTTLDVPVPAIADAEVASFVAQAMRRS